MIGQFRSAPRGGFLGVGVGWGEIHALKRYCGERGDLGKVETLKAEILKRGDCSRGRVG